MLPYIKESLYALCHCLDQQTNCKVRATQLPSIGWPAIEQSMKNLQIAICSKTCQSKGCVSDCVTVHGRR